MKHRSLLLRRLAAAAALAFLTGCSSAVANSTSSASLLSTGAAAASTLSGVSVEYTERDLDPSWSAASATALVCSGTDVTITGSGASAANGVITITAAGTYALSGTLRGSVCVEAGSNDKVQLVLNGISVQSSDGPALWIKTADKVFVTLADNTQNALTDSENYTLEADSDEPNACLYSKADLTCNGGGSLTVSGNYHHALYGKDEVKICGGTYTLTAVSDGLKGKDCVAVYAGNLTITAGGDGIQSNNAEDAALGYVSLDGGAFSITATGDGVQAETVLQLAPESLRVTTGGGSQNASTAADWGTWSSDTGETVTSAKGLKAGTFLLAAGGAVTVDSSDDALHADGSVAVTGGTLSLASGDDGVHAGETLRISDGDITVSQSYEGLEGSDIEISGGSLHITASDDGLNAAGGSDGSSVDGRPGQNTFSGDSAHAITISGGVTVVDAGGDGVDSNGSVAMTDGILLVSGPTNDGNGAVDYDSSACISGGLAILAGSTGMAQNFSADSTQGALLASTGTLEAQTRLSLCDADGNVLLSWVPGKAYACAVLSAPGLTTGDSYTLYTGGTASEANADGFAQSGTLNDGTALSTVTLSSLLQSDSGMGGMGGGRGAAPAGGAAPDATAGATTQQEQTPSGNPGGKGGPGDMSAQPTGLEAG